MNDPALRYRMPAGILHAELDDEEVLLNPQTGMYHLVNRTGRFLLDRMDAGESLGQAIRSLSAGAGEDLHHVKGDALSFVEAMTTRGLLEPVTD
jgi:Coenzyme PQQ synthesis protein D (PqqD)